MALIAPPVNAAINQPVKVEGGWLAGAPGRDPSVTAFKGIPFAVPPVGDMRWKAPAPAAAWTGVRKADGFGPSCIQAIVQDRKPWTYEFMAHGEISEDCLSLNVWTLAKSASEKRPVYVYFYGGGFSEGSGAIPVYDGEGLAKKGIVAVTINYRVGVFGFLAHPELTRESAYEASGNYGLLDQIAALQWVRNNIKAFIYLWDHTLPGPDAERYGAFHTGEVPYVMNTLYMSDRPFVDEDRKIADMMSSY
jgi:para-nitrobenzyl esterase